MPGSIIFLANGRTNGLTIYWAVGSTEVENCNALSRLAQLQKLLKLFELFEEFHIIQPQSDKRTGSKFLRNLLFFLVCLK